MSDGGVERSGRQPRLGIGDDKLDGDRVIGAISARIVPICRWHFPSPHLQQPVALSSGCPRNSAKRGGSRPCWRGVTSTLSGRRWVSGRRFDGGFCDCSFAIHTHPKVGGGRQVFQKRSRRQVAGGCRRGSVGGPCPSAPCRVHEGPSTRADAAAEAMGKRRVRRGHRDRRRLIARIGPRTRRDRRDVRPTSPA